ncbi:TFIIB-type zinc ribbon-containing protein [Actinosynnema sp. NPDC004786]
MICPKCQDLMRTISRGSVHIEQCDNCKGVFLDGGELEQIIAAERAHYAQPYRPEGVPAPVPVVEPTTAVPVADVAADGEQSTQVTPAAGPPPPYQPPPGAQPAGAPPPYQPPPAYQPPPGTVAPVPPPVYPPGYYEPHYPRRKRSFLEELLD